MITRIKKYMEFRKEFNQLNSLSDRELKDIGIHRSQIKSIVLGLN